MVVDTWIFGYGSLLWYTNFPVERALVGRIKGFARRFWQCSPDHRGTPEKPGRTVTLLKDECSYVTGIAYMIHADNTEQVMRYLDFREKAGYVLTQALFEPDDKLIAPFEINVYVTAENNEHYTGGEPVDTIANIVVNSVGPSGTNIEYVLRLAHMLRSLNKTDPHVFELEDKVLQLCQQHKHHDTCFDQLNININNHSTLQ